MIQQVDERVHRFADFRMVVHPADSRIDLARAGDLYLETVTVHLTALVPHGSGGQGLGSFEAEFFDDRGSHDWVHTVRGLEVCASRGSRFMTNEWPEALQTFGSRSPGTLCQAVKSIPLVL